jgi:DNA mismatch endonuclease (patch repair protein)
MFHDVPAVTRARMGQVRKKNTGPELVVRKVVHRLGYRFTLHRRELAGTPDIVLPRHRSVIYVHGCFWHRHDCSLAGRVPVTRPEYWLPKFERNIARDRMNQKTIGEQGWRSLVVWECEARDAETLQRKLRDFLPPREIARALR